MSFDEHAERWVEQMRIDAAHAYVEKPAMRAKLPHLQARSVLALGCGSGEEIAMLLTAGATTVVGVDSSASLIDHARRAHPSARFVVGDVEALAFDGEQFDFVYSSLALHYSADWRPALRTAHEALRPGGTMLFSVPHPVLWAGDVQRSPSGKSKLLGYSVDSGADEPVVEVHGDYLCTTERNEMWFGDFPVTYFIKPFGQAFREIRETGFELLDLVEPKAIDAALDADPHGYVKSYGSAAHFHAIHQRLPLFAVFEIRKR